MTAEKAGVPAAGVMTSAFVDAAQLMAKMQGAPEFEFVVIEHPIASADQEGLLARAAVATDAATAIWLGA